MVRLPKCTGSWQVANCVAPLCNSVDIVQGQDLAVLHPAAPPESSKYGIVDKHSGLNGRLGVLPHVPSTLGYTSAGG